MKLQEYSTDHIRLRIAELESHARQQEEAMKDSVQSILHDLKPVNLIKDAFSGTVKSPGFTKNLVGGAIGLAAGFLSKKIFVRGSSSIVKKALGTVVELGVAKVVSNKADTITAGGIKMLNKAIR